MATATLSRYARVDPGPFRFGQRTDPRSRSQTFGQWLEGATPAYRWDWPHLRRLQAALDQITQGQLDRLIVLMPPRHGKSECCTIRYPAYRLERDPSTRVIQAAYNQTLAEKFSRKTRRIVRERSVPLSVERTAASDWETAKAGGVRAVGVGAGVAGHGADLILIDDPIKNREEAESPTYRDRLWEWFTDDIMTRREPGAAVVVTVTPWHHDDLIARILASPDGPRWTVIRFPALAEENDPLGRAEGAALCPDRFDEQYLAEQRTLMGAYGFESLYQCRPTPRDGNMFPRSKVRIVANAPAGTRWCRAWDKAGTAGGGKRTAGIKLGIGPDGLVYVGHRIAGQWNAAEREQVIRDTARMDGIGVVIELEQEPGSGGKESAESSVLGLSGYDVRAKPATGDKTTRADPLAAQWQANGPTEPGNVCLVEGTWNAEYLDTMELAPNGKYLDDMDASAMAFNRLKLHNPPQARQLFARMG